MIAAIIFDMDGVISDTQKLHSQVESNLLARFGIKITPQEITRKYSGVRTKDFFVELLRQQKKEYDVDALMNEKWKEMEKFASHSVDAIPGSINLIKKSHDSGLALAVASASNKRYVDSVIDSLRVKGFFSAIISGDMVSRGKPDPEIFLLAASKLGADPAECVVIEDGVSGMEAAKAAGMKCIGLVEDKNRSYPTQNLVTSLSEITPDFLSKLK